MIKPLLSICCLTYNHAPYIRQCLDGFVMQKTNFPIEVLIHDDASTDGTADIIREYEQKYPKLIKPIYQKENQYSKGIRISGTYNFPRIKGKYVAMCEGDDYWTDENKLQKQVDFLEANDSFSICFHPVKVYIEEKKRFIKNFTVPEVPETTDIKELAKGNFINTPSVVYRYNKKVFDDIKNLPKLPVGDYYLHMLFAKHGKIKKLPDNMAVYRIHKGGTWSSKPIEYTYPIWLKVLVGLIYYFIENREVCNILIEQYRRINTPEHPDFISKTATMYFNTGKGYSEKEKYSFSFTGNEAEINCQVPKNTIAIRLDPIESYGCILSNLEMLSYNGIINYEPINGYKNDSGDMVFINTDPQINLEGATHWIKIKYHILLLLDFLHYRVFDNFFEINKQRNNLITERDELTIKRDELLAERNNLIAKYPELSVQNYTLFIDTGKGYSDNEKIVHSFTGSEIEISCQIPENTIAVRLDPIEGYGCVISNLEIFSFGGIVNYEPVNGYKNENGDLVFINIDPQIEFYGTIRWLKIKYQITPLSDFSYYRVFNNFFEISQQRDNLIIERSNLTIERDNVITERNNLIVELNRLTAERNTLVAERDGLINSRSWRFTKPLRNFVAFIKRHRTLYLFVKGIISIKRYGIITTVKKTINYRKDNHYGDKNIHKETIRKYDTSSLISFVKTVKLFGGTIFGKKILDKWNADKLGKNVLLISHELNLTGAPMALFYFAENLKENGYCPIIISLNDGSLRSLLLKENFPVIIYNKLYTSELIMQYASLFEFLIVNTIVGAPIISALNGKNIPILWWIHEANVSYHEGALLAMPEHLKENIHVYCAGPYAVTLLKKYRPNYQINELQLYIPDHMKSLPRKNLLKIKSAKGKCIFVLVGMQEERKGQDILIQAIRMLPLEQLKKCLFIFVGRKYYVPIMTSILEILNEYPENIQFFEELDRKSILSLYQQMDCFICPSRDDTGPIVVYEAMVMSKIIICSENTGAAKFLEEMNAGLIYRNNSPEELSQQIQFVLGNRLNLSQMCEQARITYDRYFSQNAFNDSVEIILKNLFNRKEKDLLYNGTVSVIIPTYNAGEDFSFLIEILKNQIGIGKLEIVVVDSGSSDGTPELAEKLGAIVLRITQSEFTHSFARNLGAKNATGEYLLFMTQDAIPTGNTWIQSLMKPILKDDVVAVSCRETPKPECDLLGRISNWIHNEYMGILQSDRIMQLPEQSNFESIRKNAQLNDVANLIRKDIFTQFWYQGNYAEDLDLGIRLIQAGYRLSLLSSVQVIHSHTRPAVYHLKRSIVDNLALKKILPDYPVQKINAQTVVNRIITSYCITIYMARFLIETCNVNESVSDFFKRIEQYYNHILSVVQNMTFDKLKEIAEEDTKIIDSEIRIFIQKLLTSYDITAYDPAISADQFNYIINIIPRYLNNGTEIFNQKFKEEISDLLVKLYGIISGCHLAFYHNEYYKEKNILNELIREYAKGI